MIKPVLLATALLASLPRLQAQRQGFSLALGGGAGITRLEKNNLDRYHIRPDQAGYWGGGGAFGLMFSGHVGFFLGLEYDLFKWKYDNLSDPFTDSVTGDIRQGFLSVPLYLHVVSGSAGRAGFFMQAGLKVAFLATITDTWRRNGREYFNTRREGYATTSMIPFLYAGLSLPMGRYAGLHIGPALQYQSSNNFIAADSNGRVLNGHLLSAALRVGVHVRLNR